MILSLNNSRNVTINGLSVNRSEATFGISPRLGSKVRKYPGLHRGTRAQWAPGPWPGASFNNSVYYTSTSIVIPTPFYTGLISEGLRAGES